VSFNYLEASELVQGMLYLSKYKRENVFFTLRLRWLRVSQQNTFGQTVAVCCGESIKHQWPLADAYDLSNYLKNIG